MVDFYFNQFSISAFSQFLLSALISLFFLLSRRPHQRSWYRLLFFLLITSFFISSFLGNSLYNYWAKFFIPLQYILISAAVLLFTQYAYRYPKLYFPQEIRRMGFIGLFVWIAFAVVLIVRMMVNQYYIPEEQQAYNLVVISGFAWSAVVIIRQGMVPLFETGSAHPRFFSKVYFRRLLSSVFQSVTGGMSERLEPFRDQLLLAGIVLIGSVPAFLNLLFHLSLISQQTNLYFSNAVWLLFLFSFILAYFKLSPEPSTISRKIIVVSMVTILVVLSTVGSATMSKLSEIFVFTREAPDLKSIEWIPEQTGGYRVETRPARWKTPGRQLIEMEDAEAVRLDLAFSFPFYNQSFNHIWVSSNGILSFGEGIRSYNTFEFFRPAPKIAVLFKDLNPEKGGKIQIEKTDSTLCISWLAVPDFSRRTPNSFQVLLTKTGSIRMTFLGISPVLPGYIGIDPGNTEDVFPVTFRNGVTLSTPPGAAAYEDYFREHREYIHQGSGIFILMIIASTILVIMVFPSFFRLTVVRPIRVLLHGVRQVNAGNLDVQVPVREDDEIGYLTKSFNQMIESVRKAKEEELLLIRKEREEQLLQLELRRKSEELEFARRLQMDMLPESLDINPAIRLAADMRTAAEVGGDYYDIIHIDKNRFCLAIGDATGHGTAAGLVVGMVKMALINSIRSYNVNLPLVKLIKNLNVALFESIHNRGIGMGLTLMVLDLDKNKIEIASTGMPFPFYYNAKNDSFRVLELMGPPLGMIRDFDINTISFAVNPGDVIMTTSDGFSERTNPDEIMWFEEKQFDRAAERIIRTFLQPSLITKEMFAACDEFARGQVHDDDMTVFVLRYLGKF